MSSIAPFGRINPELLYPPFRALLEELIAECRRLGAYFFATAGYRSGCEQTKLWCQGRTTTGPIVTQARAGESAHNYGIAADFVRSVYPDRVVPDWSGSSYDVLGAVARELGLVWGGTWKTPDRPHIQLEGYVTRLELLALLEAAGKPLVERREGPEPFLSRVWAELDADRKPA
jgi:peptidoglycan L-alanyl-D-glutamate endopeptidase CwlK